MAKNYQWRTDASIISGGYDGEDTGIITGSTEWHTTDILTGSTSAQYYFRDSDRAQNANSSRVVVSISESWVASISSRNYLTVTLTTTINNIVRDDIRGNPGTLGRSFFVRREAGGPLIWSLSNDPINYAHTILGTPLTLDSYTFTLAPGENLSRGSVYFRGNTQGHDGDTPPSAYIDLMWLGTQFRNILPKDYRPGATLNTNNSIWRSHDRTNGACHILSNTSSMHWHECRTVGGDEGEKGNPPLILTAPNANSWRNQKKLGKE